VKLSGLHILLTYQCTRACEHCFVWGSPRQRGVFGLEQIEQVLEQAKEAGVEWVYFEGGEPFIYYNVLIKGVQRAKEMGFAVGYRIERLLGRFRCRSCRASTTL